MSDYRVGSDVIDRLTAEKLGIIFVGNGVYHAAAKEAGKTSSILEKKANLYVLTEDLEEQRFYHCKFGQSGKSIVAFPDIQKSTVCPFFTAASDSFTAKSRDNEPTRDEKQPIVNLPISASFMFYNQIVFS